MLVSSDASLRWKYVKLAYKSLFNRKVFYYSSNFDYSRNGRHALRNVISILSKNKPSKVVVPAFICSSIPVALRQDHNEVVFVDSDPNSLWPSVSSILKSLEDSSCSFVLIPSYFGFSYPYLQELYNSLRERQVFLILDEAHSCNYFYNHFPTQNCDAIIFSFRKQFPLLNGGGFVVFGSEFTGHSRPIIFPSILFKLSFEILLIILKRSLLSLRLQFSSLRSLLAFSQLQETKQIKSPSPNYKVSYLLSSLLNNQDILKSAAMNRINAYNLYNKALGSSFGLDFRSVEDVPQVYPIKGTKCLLKFLISRGVSAYLWPYDDIDIEVNQSPRKYPNALSLANSVLCLPCHQEIGMQQANRVISLIKEFELQK